MFTPIKSTINFLRRRALSLSLTTLIAIFFVVLLANRIFISIPAGHAGVLWERFGGGTNVEYTYPEGFHIIGPWNRMTLYNIRLNEATSTISVLAKDGLELEVEFLVRYRPISDTLGVLHKHMGADYLKILIMPEVNSRGRVIMANYSAEEIYSTRRQEIQEGIQSETRAELRVTLMKETEIASLVMIEDVLLKTITLPDAVRKAIERKIEHKHRMLQYKYILSREKQESLRKEIEARGIAKFQEIVKDGISDRYLRWKGIDATLELAKSNNSKVVIIGAGKEGMPLILGNMGAQPTIATPSEKVKKAAKTAPSIALKSKKGADVPEAMKEEEKSSFEKAFEALSFSNPKATQAPPVIPNKGGNKKP